MRSLSLFVILFIVLIQVNAYERLTGFHLNNGDQLSAHSLKRDVEEIDVNTNWYIYTFITISYSGFDLDETVSFTLENESSTRVFDNIPVEKGAHEFPVGGVLPGENYTFTITGEQSGHTATMDHIKINLPRPYRPFQN